ncbi:hypothetical protein ACIQ2D_09915 [Lysinibacillus sp. NPDC097287]|uniref:hypothetical protein n=1 Tax=Lysinibacillus sp. NPDC097287 TaxID=3364144 RepID=UPI003816EE5D
MNEGLTTYKPKYSTAPLPKRVEIAKFDERKKVGAVFVVPTNLLAAIYDGSRVI